MTNVLPAPVFGAPSRSSRAITPARSASAASVTSRLMKPGPAISILAKSGLALRRSATFWAMSRGLARISFAAANAPLHWNCARSGRSDGITCPNFAGSPSAANAADAIALNSATSAVMGRSAPSCCCSRAGPWSTGSRRSDGSRRNACPSRPSPPWIRPPR